jgi:hypothetical protein
MKTGPDAPGTAENMSWSGKLENGKGRPWYRRKISSGAQNKKMGPEGHDTVENDSGSAKCENGTRCPWYRRKRVRERKT